MNDHEQSIRDLEQRLASLERKSSVQRRSFVVALAVLTTMVFCMGFLWPARELGAQQGRAKAQAGIQDEVKARSIVLFDKDNNERGRLRIDDDGGATFILRSKNQRRNIILTAKDDRTAFSLSDSAGLPDLMLTCDERGVPSMYMTRAEKFGSPSLTIAMDGPSPGIPTLRFSENAKDRLLMTYSQKRNPGIILYNADGKAVNGLTAPEE